MLGNIHALPDPERDRSSNQGRGFRPLIIRGRLAEPEPGQASRLFEAETRAASLIAHVREIDPKWRPRPSAHESVEGLIRAYEADAEQAQARLRELAAPIPHLVVYDEK